MQKMNWYKILLIPYDKLETSFLRPLLNLGLMGKKLTPKILEMKRLYQIRATFSLHYFYFGGLLATLQSTTI